MFAGPLLNRFLKLCTGTAGEQSESEQFACGVAEKVEILCEMASFGDALKEALALIANVVTGFNVDIVCVEARSNMPISVMSSKVFSLRALASASVRRSPMIAMPFWVMSGRVLVEMTGASSSD